MANTDSTGQFALVSDGTSPASPVIADGAAVYTPGLSERRNGASFFRHDDLLGSLRFLTDSSEGVQAYRLFSGLGATVAASGAAWEPFGWAGSAGDQTDADTGLVLMGHRLYDSRLGRFISQDPAGDGDNWYQYAGNDPINNTDPSGLSRILMGELNLPGHWSQDDVSNYLLTNDYAAGTYDVNKGTAGAFQVSVAGIAAVMGTALGSSSIGYVTYHGYTPKQKSTLQKDLRIINTTKRGHQLVQRMMKSKHNYKIINKKGAAHAWTGGPIELDPNISASFENLYGDQPASLLRILAHELGHAVQGLVDDGPGDMNNVLKTENPIMWELTGGDPKSLRTHYP